MAALEGCATCGAAATGAARPQLQYALCRAAGLWGGSHLSLDSAIQLSLARPFRASKRQENRTAVRVAATSRKIPTTQWPGGKSKYKGLAEAAWRRVMEDPLGGVPFTCDELAAALDEYEVDIEVGSTVVGTVVTAGSHGLLVDVGGAKAAARVPLQEVSLRRVQKPEEAGLFPGARAEFCVLEGEDGAGALTLSVRELQRQVAWERCQQLQQEAAVVLAEVAASNRGGLLVDVEGIQGFLPFAQLSNYVDRDRLVGRRLPVVVLQVDPTEDKLICSNRRAHAALRPALVPGVLVEGVVRVVKPWGAFVDLGACQALLHVSQISGARIEDISEVLKEGDTVKAIVTEDDLSTGRTSISTKLLEQKSGDMTRDRSRVFEQAKVRADSKEMVVALREHKEQMKRREQAAKRLVGSAAPPSPGSWTRAAAQSSSSGLGAVANKSR